MAASSAEPNCRFGAYEVDRRAGELRKSGVRIRVQEQPFRILTALLDRPGELVTREELRQILWPGDTFVDFEHSLNAAVNKLRELLGDSANHPCFVETVPRRGYRFIYPLHGAAAQPLASVAHDSIESAPAVPLPNPSRSRRRWVIGLAGLLTATAAAGIWYSFQSSEHPISLRAVPLTSYLGTEADASLSPDGTLVAFTWNGLQQDNYDIYVKTMGSEAPQRLTYSPDVDYEPAWSPDGRWIAFLRHSAGQPAVYLVPPVGGREHKVADVSPSRGGIEWWPDGKSLVISEPAAPGKVFALYRLWIDSGEKRQLTSPPPDFAGDNQPAFSPDGRTLAFVRWNFMTSGRIHLTTPQGSAARPVGPENTWIVGIDWTSDSRELIFSEAGYTGFQTSLYRVSVSGGEPTLLVGGGEGGQYPAVSGPARRLVYERTKFDPNIWRYDLPGTANGAGRRRLIASTQAEFGVQFSPDGKRMVMGSNRSGTTEIWVCDVDSSGCFPASDLGGDPAGSPRWSRDNSRIAFDAVLNGSWEICVLDLERRTYKVLTQHDAEDSRPSWSYDGGWIYFASNRSGRHEVWKVPADGGDPERVTSDGGFNPFESADGRFLYYVKGYLAKYTGQTELWRMDLSTGVETHVLELPEGMEGAWDLVDSGVYFLAPENDSERKRWVLRFLDFATGEVRHSLDMNCAPAFWATPFDVSPDGTWLAYVRTDEENEHYESTPPYKYATGDLMLVEGFR